MASTTASTISPCPGWTSQPWPLHRFLSHSDCRIPQPNGPATSWSLPSDWRHGDPWHSWQPGAYSSGSISPPIYYPEWTASWLWQVVWPAEVASMWCMDQREALRGPQSQISSSRRSCCYSNRTMVFAAPERTGWQIWWCTSLLSLCPTSQCSWTHWSLHLEHLCWWWWSASKRSSCTVDFAELPVGSLQLRIVPGQRGCRDRDMLREQRLYSWSFSLCGKGAAYS